MADAFAVDLDRLANIVERMASYQQVVDSMLDECDAVVANLHAQWDGVASQSHAAVHEQWKQGADMMRVALGQLHAAGAHAHSSYSGAVEANLKIWG
ncbi:WXG100 family type VII secretion target [Mycolicibacterium sp. BK556]|uniref:WXG100 family type VII secretion target n=1 Tax=unclassified Mycolicibacterium TaxID=2636767 RepID=UPI001609AC35|nr:MULTISPECIES: WXG100 family type VII secretion target [unclassified Mycolicibacterium]MBB3602524.1 WXG100 family type VII secretion target [Mycolicibacterium sp. BK556]MBB3632276.1 WXG100 family type VII secretion target [Mycolicibacterium sp. BK607]MBB3750297.1 WXG100 family type VII secretion target [Mycolicibacterium sp. BK634]